MPEPWAQLHHPGVQPQHQVGGPGLGGQAGAEVGHRLEERHDVRLLVAEGEVDEHPRRGVDALPGRCGQRLAGPPPSAPVGHVSVLLWAHRAPNGTTRAWLGMCGTPPVFLLCVSCSDRILIFTSFLPAVQYQCHLPSIVCVLQKRVGTCPMRGGPRERSS